MISVGHRRNKIQVKLVKIGPLIDNMIIIIIIIIIMMMVMITIITIVISLLLYYSLLISICIAYIL